MTNGLSVEMMLIVMVVNVIMMVLVMLMAVVLLMGSGSQGHRLGPYLPGLHKLIYLILTRLL